MEIFLATIWRILSLLFFMFVLWGFTEWTENLQRPSTRELRHYVVAAGLAMAFIPASCFAGLILYPRGTTLGAWSHYLIASALGRWNLPLAVLSVLLGVIGKGSGRWLLVIGGGCLVLVWMMAVVHWPGST
jgi:hypothetical protein